MILVGSPKLVNEMIKEIDEVSNPKIPTPCAPNQKAAILERMIPETNVTN